MLLHAHRVLLIDHNTGGEISRFHAVLGASAYGYQHPAHQNGRILRAIVGDIVGFFGFSMRILLRFTTARVMIFAPL